MTELRACVDVVTQATLVAANDRYTRFQVVMPTEGTLTDAGLEVWPCGVYNLVMQITR